MPKTPESQLKFIKLLHHFYTILNIMMAVIFDLFAYMIFQTYLNIDAIKENSPEVKAEDILFLLGFILAISLFYWFGALFSAVIAKKMLSKDAYLKLKKMVLYECIVFPIGPLIGILTWKMLDKPDIKSYYEKRID